jgi:hypothetical protein
MHPRLRGKHRRRECLATSEAIFVEGWHEQVDNN